MRPDEGKDALGSTRANYDLECSLIIRVRPTHSRDRCGVFDIPYEVEIYDMIMTVFEYCYLGGLCAQGSFYAYFTTDGKLDHPLGNYSGASCPVK
jgi:hypothetical protein